MAPEERITALKEAPADGWVAFSDDENQVVAYGATYEEAVSEAQRRGVADPVLVKVPDDWIVRVMRA
jgi:hypothetical protein